MFTLKFQVFLYFNIYQQFKINSLNSSFYKLSTENSISKDKKQYATTIKINKKIQQKQNIANFKIR